MGPFILRRVLLMIPTFIGITLLTFAVMQLAPGDPLALRSDAPEARGQTREALEAQRRAHGLDAPIPLQYARWVGRVVTFDFGRSYQDGQRVIDRIGQALPTTLLLSSLALFLSYLFAIPLGVFSAVRQDSRLERAVTVGVFILYSLPAFWVAVMLLLYLASSRGLAFFPMQGLTSPGFESLGAGAKVLDLLWHLVLPVTVLTYGSLALLSRYVRNGMLEVIRQDFIRTARAKGLPERAVVLRHALRNSVLPIITLLGLMVPHLVGGSVIVEQIFGIHGMGLLAFQAITQRDYPMVMGITTLAAILTLVSMLASDVLYAWADPRIDAGALK